MTALARGLELHRPLHHAARSGVAFVPEALDERFRQRLLREIENAPFEPMPGEVGAYAVHQHGGQLFIAGTDLTAWPAIDELRRDFLREAHEQGAHIDGIPGWAPNEAAVQRYPAETGSIGVHRDGKRYAALVVIFTVEGSAPLALCADREGTVTHRWQTAPGSLTLLRGPGLAHIPDARPLHRVDAPTGGPRTSLTFRMDTRQAPQ